MLTWSRRTDAVSFVSGSPSHPRICPIIGTVPNDRPTESDWRRNVMFANAVVVIHVWRSGRCDASNPGRRRRRRYWVTFSFERRVTANDVRRAGVSTATRSRTAGVKVFRRRGRDSPSGWRISEIVYKEFVQVVAKVWVVVADGAGLPRVVVVFFVLKMKMLNIILE